MAIPRTVGEAAELLGLAPGASRQAVIGRHRRLAQIFHPDLNPQTPKGDERMQELNVARDLLLGKREASPLGGDQRAPEPQRTYRRTRAERDLERRLSEALRLLSYGTYVIGTSRDGVANVMVADWAMQVSFQPRLLAVSFENDSHSLGSVRRNDSFTLNLLPVQAMDLVASFLQPHDGAKIRGRSAQARQRHDKLAGVAYETTAKGCPILEEALAWIECEAQHFQPAGDHTLVLAAVRDGDVQLIGEPITSMHTGWEYGG